MLHNVVTTSKVMFSAVLFVWLQGMTSSPSVAAQLQQNEELVLFVVIMS